MEPLALSVVVLAWDQLQHTEKCVASIRANTTVPYELIIVDNGSEPEAAEFASDHADVFVRNETNQGFAAGMNQGLNRATGMNVAFVNNDTTLPKDWDVRAIELLADPNIGLVAPAVTAAGNPVTVRSDVSDNIVTLEPFCHLPSGVVYVMRRETCLELGGWNEMYPIASSEDLDLVFTTWTNNLDVVIDERVLVHHVSRGTVKAKLPNRSELYASNLQLFLARWQGTDEIVRIPSCDPAIHELNRRAGRAAAVWLGRLIAERQSSVPQPQPTRTARWRRKRL